MDGFSIIIQQFDRGIQSRSISEQLATVVNTVSLVKKNPFPNLVNSIVVRLSEHFVSGSNCLRGAIARSLSQMDEQLLLVFSHNEVCRRLLIVSHCNDPIARAHTLFALSAIAVIAKQNKEVHTFVVDSLSSNHKEEFDGACSAVTAFCSLSTDFTRTVLAQISDFLLSSTSPIERKIQIVSIFSNIQSDQESTQSIFALGAKLFELNTDLTFLSTLLSSLTSLAIHTRFSILDQLSLLFSVLSSTVDISPPLSFVALSNISRLANHAHVWTKEHISRLGEYRHRLTHDEEVCCALLHTLELLGRRRLPSHMGVLQEILSEMSPLYSHDSLRIRASFIAFSTHIFVSSPSDLHRQNLLNSISASLSVPLPTKIGVKISKVAGVFLTNDAVSDEEALILVSSLCKLPLSHANTSLFLHLFCLLSQKRRVFIPPISKWAMEAMQSQSSFSPSQLSFIAFPPFAPEGDIDVTPFNKLPYTTLFEIARGGFRNGHWRSISLPLLKSMAKLSLSSGTRDYLVALSQIAQSQATKCTVSDVQLSVALLSRAKRTLLKLSRSPVNPLQSFCYRYVETLEKTRQAQMQLMSTLTVFVSFPSPDGPLLSIRPISFRIFEVLQSCLPSLTQSITDWSLLLRRSFDGDDHSIDLVNLEIYSAAIVEYGIRCIVDREAPVLPLLSPLSSESVIINETRSLLLWAASSMQQLAGREGKVNTKSLDHFFSIFRHIYTRPLFMPRLFFQPTRRTTIKLSVSPGAEGELAVSPSVPVPIRIDGVISTTRKTHIQSIIVSANIHFYSTKTRDRLEVRRVETHDGNFFTAQFLLKFEESAQMDLSVELVDGEKRKKWLSDASTTLRVDVNM